MEVRLFRPEDKDVWQAHIKNSYNGTLFEDLNFLSYHPTNKFKTHHLLFYENEKLIAVLAAAIVVNEGKQILKSPYGASTGGLIYASGTGFVGIDKTVKCLVEYAKAQEVDAIVMRVPPFIYGEPLKEDIAFSYFKNGFTLSKRWLTMVATLPESNEVLYSQLPERKYRYYKQAIKHNLVFEAVDKSKLEKFYEILLINRAKFNALPTHSLSDLQYLLTYCGSSIKLYLTRHQHHFVAGAMIFELTPTVAYVFYLCHLDEAESMRASLFTILKVQEFYIAKGFKYLDLGPSSFDNLEVNAGGVQFKEDIGCKGFMRDEWTLFF